MPQKTDAKRFELAIPAPTESDPKAFELLRVWAAHGDQHVTIRPDLHGGPEGFGYMLAQLARHGALLYGQREGRPPAEVLKLVKLGFDQEWNDGSWPSGKVSVSD
jgi:hypothetical protein